MARGEGRFGRLSASQDPIVSEREEGMRERRERGGKGDWNARRTEAGAEQSRAEQSWSRARIKAAGSIKQEKCQEVWAERAWSGFIRSLVGWPRRREKKRVPVPGPCSTKWTG